MQHDKCGNATDVVMYGGHGYSAGWDLKKQGWWETWERHESCVGFDLGALGL
jgi:hypothetical protein